MAGNDGARSESEDDGQGKGAAPPSESKGDGGKPPGDEMISKRQFTAALNHATRETDSLKQQVAELQAKLQHKDEDTRKPATRAELRKMVEGGDLTQDQADAIYDKQVRDEVKREAASVAGRVLSEHGVAQRIESQLSAYKTLVPEVWDKTSEEYVKAMKEYQELVSLGQPATDATQLAALRNVYGDVETLRASKTARRGSTETHSETGGHRPGGDGGGNKDGALKDLSPRQRQHYEGLISRGVYPDWKAVAEELKHAGPRRNAR